MATAFRLAATLVLSRNISPGDLGIFLRYSVPILLVGYFAEEALPARLAIESATRSEMACVRYWALMFVIPGAAIIAVLAWLSAPSFYWKLVALTNLVPLPLQAIAGPSRMLMRYRRRHFLRAAYVVLPAAILLITSVGMLGVGAAGYVALAVGSAVSSLSGPTLALLSQREGLGFQRCLRSEPVIHYGLNAARNEALIFGRTMGDSYTVTWLLGAAPGGTYSRAFSVPQTLGSSALTTLRPILAPELAIAKDAIQRRRIAVQFALRTSALLLALLAPLLVIPGPAIRILFGDGWSDVADLTPWVVAISVVSSFFSIGQIGDQVGGSFQSSFRVNQALLLATAVGISVATLYGHLDLAVAIPSVFALVLFVRQLVLDRALLELAKCSAAPAVALCGAYCMPVRLSIGLLGWAAASALAGLLLLRNGPVVHHA